MCIKEMDEETLRTHEMPFSIPSATGQEVQLSSKYNRISLENRAEYIKLAMNYRWVDTDSFYMGSNINVSVKYVYVDMVAYLVEHKTSVILVT